MSTVHEDVAKLINTHGLNAVTSATAAAAGTASQIGGGSTVASYIKEIITGDQAFDENVLARVSKVLSSGGAAAAAGK